MPSAVPGSLALSSASITFLQSSPFSILWIDQLGLNTHNTNLTILPAYLQKPTPLLMPEIFRITRDEIILPYGWTKLSSNLIKRPEQMNVVMRILIGKPNPTLCGTFSSYSLGRPEKYKLVGSCSCCREYKCHTVMILLSTTTIPYPRWKFIQDVFCPMALCTSHITWPAASTLC